VESWEPVHEKERISSQKTWNRIMKSLNEPFSVVIAAMDEGLLHAGFVLELLPKPKTNNVDDEEAKGTSPLPGDPKFADYIEQKVLEFYSERGKAFRAWARLKGLSVDRFNTASEDMLKTNNGSQSEFQHYRDQQQLYLILYMEDLVYAAGRAVAALVRFADRMIEDGTMKKKRLILPSGKRLRKWFLCQKPGHASVNADSLDSLAAGRHIVYTGDGFNVKRDPEHLPPQTAWVRVVWLKLLF
jgi:hypothetical protein